MPRRRTPRKARSLLRSLLPAASRKRAPRPPKPARAPKAGRLPEIVPLPGPLPAIPRPARRRQGSGRWVRGGRSAPVGGRSYDVYLPAGLRPRSRVPMVLLLHGCGQTSAEFASATRFTDVADRNGFVLVLPHQETRHHPNRCWRWYEVGNQSRGAGEPAALTVVVRQVLAEQVRWRIDPRRVYVAGLSAGGAMALTLAATYPDVFAAAGVHSAPPYRSASSGGQGLSAMAGRTIVPPPVPGVAKEMAPVVVLQGTADHLVRPLNGDRVADQWLAYRTAAAAGGPDPGRIGRTRADSGRTTDGREYTVVRWYSVRGRKMLEYWLVDGLGHAWSGGRKGGSYSDPTGPRAATVMWQFFRTHRSAGSSLARRAAGM